MKQSIRVFLLFFSTFFVLIAGAQQMTIDQWEEEAKTNLRLKPKYGHIQKSEAQNKIDQNFIESVLKNSTPREASDKLIKAGFNYLNNTDLKSAMYRFNQAYLLDSTNTDIYWGFGGVYMVLGAYQKAKTQYEEGLAINPNNTHLLTDYGSYFMAQNRILETKDKKQAQANLDSAITQLLKSYQIDSKNQNTTYKLSICYQIKGDCLNAWKYYDICKVLGGDPISENYSKFLMQKCPR